MDQLIAGKCPASRQLDLLEAVKSRSADLPALAEKLNAFEAPRAPFAATPAAFTECLEGGSSAAGKEIVKEHLAANCIACHRFDSKEGSNVGPLLSTIGAQKDRKYLLESLVSPMATVAPGYGMVVVSLKDGKSLSGSLVSKDDKNVVLRMADGKEAKTDAAQIAGMTDPISVMPPMSAILTKRELRDVVAYLAGLKGKSKSSEVAAKTDAASPKGKTGTPKGKTATPKGKAAAPKGKSSSKKKK
jgi:putative heme-binding domain-containing protein